MVRLKHRYLLLRIEFKEKKAAKEVDSTVLFKALRQKIVSQFGAFGYGLASSSLAGAENSSPVFFLLISQIIW